MSLELFFQDIIKEKRREFIPSLLKFPLKLLSYPYGLVVRCRNWAYDHGWFKQYSPPIPLVVSIGNITVGGTGKTPFTILFAKAFEDELRLAIASRGYRAKAEHLKMPVVVSSGAGPQHSVALCGDEPYLLAENLKKVHVYAGKNRIQSANMAAKAGIQLLILDDGMQHRQLAREIDIVVLDARDPFGKGYFLPYGLLRDELKSLSRAHLIVLNHVRDPAHFNEIKILVGDYSKAPVIGVKTVIDGVFDLSGNKIEVTKGQQVGIFCGIANPEQFLYTVERLGADVVESMYFPDHTLGKHKLLNQFAEKSRIKGAALLLCSEKDKVKIVAKANLSLPVGWVKMRLEIIEGNDIWNYFIGNLKKKLDTRVIQ